MLKHKKRLNADIILIMVMNPQEFLLDTFSRYSIYILLIIKKSVRIIYLYFLVIITLQKRKLIPCIIETFQVYYRSISK